MRIQIDQSNRFLFTIRDNFKQFYVYEQEVEKFHSVVIIEWSNITSIYQQLASQLEVKCIFFSLLERYTTTELNYANPTCIDIYYIFYVPVIIWEIHIFCPSRFSNNTLTKLYSNQWPLQLELQFAKWNIY